MEGLILDGNFLSNEKPKKFKTKEEELIEAEDQLKKKDDLSEMLINNNDQYKKFDRV